MPSAARSAPPSSSPAADPPPRLDGRRTHIVDRALDYAQLAEQGMSSARIARLRRRSAGYVSIALRLGRAIRGMEPAELAAFRSPRITWKLAQRIVRDDADPLAIRHQLRAALGGFSSHNVDGRKHRKRARGAASSAARQRPVGAAWGWDAVWFARDPLGFVDAHLRYLVGLQRVVQERATRAAGTRAVDRVPVGQGIRSLQRSLARVTRDESAVRGVGAAEPPTPERRALVALDIIAAKLAEARAAADESLGSIERVTEAGSAPTAAISGTRVYAPDGAESSPRAPAGAARWRDPSDELDD